MIRALPRLAVALAALLLSVDALAQGFAVLASPPRIEASARPGQTYRDVVELTNTSSGATALTVRSADWTLDPAGSAAFDPALAEGSCRPWVGIEAHRFELAPGGKRRYRFEVAVPADAPQGECRFALMFEGAPETAPGAMPVPVSGRLGIIVYLAIGDAASRLSLTGSHVSSVQGQTLPVLEIRNDGDAHGRLDGYLDGVDADGRRMTFAPATLPILPGETRAIALAPVLDDSGTPAPAIRYPLVLKGHLDAAGQRIGIDATVAP
ncbi:hypothetical protein [Marilutibacter chinensis]|uniref:Pili assembly chaperone N-terminal domain-containing protein n=1 Tax=Marilutibacter chinensis TaxID=2912247 RepID=A0ABS9HUI9_9GAMM|nr:hypothetical protein [Lysobacter chinensis]MCF7221767.1 hypothetical protein [Lysobacter chinensis]MCF7223703.1 hypothetical protein [Lysobacter chinensis]